jgi:ribosomal protein S18 acetylase RimI-like enzyme
MLEIQLAKKGDLYRIAEMTSDLTCHLGAFEWKVENHLKHIKRRYANSRYFYLVAIENGNIVGFSGAELKSGKLAYLMKGYVEPAYRRKKIMRHLEDKLIEILREKGISKIELKVHSRNKEGRAAWIALGYKTISETMRKEIN